MITCVAKYFLTFIASLFEGIWVSSLMGELFKLVVNFSFLSDKTTKLGSQRIMVKSSEVS